MPTLNALDYLIYILISNVYDFVKSHLAALGHIRHILGLKQEENVAIHSKQSTLLDSTTSSPEVPIRQIPFQSKRQRFRTTYYSAVAKIQPPGPPPANLHINDGDGDGDTPVSFTPGTVVASTSVTPTSVPTTMTHDPLLSPTSPAPTNQSSTTGSTIIPVNRDDDDDDDDNTTNGKEGLGDGVDTPPPPSQKQLWSVGRSTASASASASASSVVSPVARLTMTGEITIAEERRTNLQLLPLQPPPPPPMEDVEESGSVGSSRSTGRTMSGVSRGVTH
jgi:hypothetical protein